MMFKECVARKHDPNANMDEKKRQWEEKTLNKRL
jgi:hypothetical protein